MDIVVKRDQVRDKRKVVAVDSEAGVVNTSNRLGGPNKFVKEAKK